MVASCVTSALSVMDQAIRKIKHWYYLDIGIYDSFSGLMLDKAAYPINSIKKHRELIESVLVGPTLNSIDVVSEASATKIIVI